MPIPKISPEQKAAVLASAEESYRCTCDFDKWAPEKDTGHCWVCRIHKVYVNDLDDIRHRRYGRGQAAALEGVEP